MRFQKQHSIYSLVLFFFLTVPAIAQLPPDLPNSELGPDVPAFRVRPGYRVTRALPKNTPLLRRARFIEFSSDSKTLYLSEWRAGTILALRNPDANGVYQSVTEFIKGRPYAQGMCFHDGWLYFACSGDGSVTRARDTKGDGVADQIEFVAPPGTFPKGGGHPYAGLLVTDKNIYYSVSDPQNMTDQLPSDRKTIYVLNLDGSNKQVFCTGVRNTEKLRYRPGTTEIWGFDNGNDRFGHIYGETDGSDQPITDLNPPEEFNLYVQGAFYGQPFIDGDRVPRPEFAKRPDILDLARKTTPPEWDVHAHWAVLGFTFITKNYFPDVHPGDCIFASHGSWDSVHPVGACVQHLMFDPLTGKPYGSQTIVDCAGPDRRYARPVDCTEAPDGSILFTSDEPPALYRVTKANDER
jgi:glucose/arabinose dehydrogenase